MTVWPLPETAVIDGALWLRTVIVPLLAAVSTGVAPYRPDTAAVGVITKEPAVLLEKLRPAFAVDELGAIVPDDANPIKEPLPEASADKPEKFMLSA